ncbi:hypothetical protein GGR50DRAFT_677217 [Xylaria sp. CBS 124048]|nr:hypothetical protein GGR50DRAFT_677217 [Xylaria sp. CBS 124048]
MENANKRPKLMPGWACLPCAQAMSTCVFSYNTDICDRCLRRGEDGQAMNCRFADEARAYDLYETASPTHETQTIDSWIKSMADAVPPRHEQSDRPTTSAPAPVEPLVPISVSIPLPLSLSPTPPIITPQQAEQSRIFFVSTMLPCFPFIHLGPDASTEWLRQNRPFLFQAIVTVTTFSAQERAALADHLTHNFLASQFKGELSIDLLLGVLVYLTWSPDLFLGKTDLVSRLMTLATSLVYDLRILKPWPYVEQLIISKEEGPYESAHDAGNGSVEGNQALLACFVLSSNISTHIGRQDALRWTPRMEEACRALENSDNAWSLENQGFVYQVRLHAIKQRAICARDDEALSVSAASTILTLAQLRDMRVEVKNSYSSVRYPLIEGHRGMFQMYKLYVEICISQLAYSVSLGPSGCRGLEHNPQRIRSLCKTAKCLVSWFIHFVATPPSDLVGLPSHFWSQMLQCLAIVKYIHSLRNPAQYQGVRSYIDIAPTLLLVIERLMMVSQEPNVGSEDGFFKLLGRFLRDFLACVLRRQGSTDRQEREVDRVDHIPELDQMGWLHMMDLQSDVWRDEILAENLVSSSSSSYDESTSSAEQAATGHA